MVSSESAKSRNTLVGVFNQHAPSLWISFSLADRRWSAIVSAFVVSIDDEWFLVTAGHCLAEIEQNLSCGAKIESCYLIDCTGNGATHQESIPFDFKGASPRHLGDDFYDYGVLRLRENTKALLRANMVRPLDESMWDMQPSDPESFMMLGIPARRVVASEGKMRFSAALLPITEITERPDYFLRNDAPTFYGRIDTTGAVSDIDGMSGGPIFSLKHEADGQLKYWLHAVQSRWVKEKSAIAGCKTTPFIRWLRASLIAI